MGKFKYLVLSVFVFFGSLVWAQTPVDPNQDFLNLLLQSLGGFNGASALAIAAIVVQLIIKFLSTSWVGSIFPNLSGGVKLVVVSGLGVVSGVLALMLPPTSLTFLAALLHSATMTAFMVFFNQAYQQWFAPPQA